MKYSTVRADMDVTIIDMGFWCLGLCALSQSIIGSNATPWIWTARPCRSCWLMNQIDPCIANDGDCDSVLILDRAKGIVPYNVLMRHIFSYPFSLPTITSQAIMSWTVKDSRVAVLLSLLIKTIHLWIKEGSSPQKEGFNFNGCKD